MISKTDKISDSLAAEVRTWFSSTALDAWMGEPDSAPDRIGREWLSADGKRLRPLLTASVFTALAGGSLARIAPVGVAVECFHKASLIHDDIEDGDTERYGYPTVHARYGVPAAINAGDWLLGEGYRLLATSDFPPAVRDAMVRVAAEGHRELARGQGDELEFCHAPHSVSVEETLKIYRQKTASAFDVAVQCGALAAGLKNGDLAALTAFSNALGVAYQIRDDGEDFYSVRGRGADLLALRPTLYLAEACRDDAPEIRALVQTAWQSDPAARQRLIDALGVSDIPGRVRIRFLQEVALAREALERVGDLPLREFLDTLLKRFFHEKNEKGEMS